jgi:hypothetical protein
MTNDQLAGDEDHEVLLARLGGLSVGSDDVVLDWLEGETLELVGVVLVAIERGRSARRRGEEERRERGKRVGG